MAWMVCCRLLCICWATVSLSGVRAGGSSADSSAGSCCAEPGEGGPVADEVAFELGELTHMSEPLQRHCWRINGEVCGRKLGASECTGLDQGVIAFAAHGCAVAGVEGTTTRLTT